MNDNTKAKIEDCINQLKNIQGDDAELFEVKARGILMEAYFISWSEGFDRYKEITEEVLNNKLI